MCKGNDLFIQTQKTTKTEYEKVSQPNQMIPLIFSNLLNKNGNLSMLKHQNPSNVKWNNFYKETNTNTITNTNAYPNANKANEPNSIESPSSKIQQKSGKSNVLWNGYQPNSPVLPNISSSKTDKKKLVFKISGELNTTFDYLLMNQSINESNNERTYNKKYNTLVNRKINSQKYSNVINSNNNTNQTKPPSNEIDIDESIRTNSVIDKSSFKHSKTNPNSINSSSSDSRFKTKTNIFEIDKYLHKTVKGKSLTWTAGEIISEGINSVVYKALNEDDGSVFVVKRFNCAKDKCESFLNEVKVYDQLSHNNIIKYYSAEDIESQLFIYLEYIPSGSLRSIIDHYGKLNETLIKHYTKQIIEGLMYLHSKGIVHRDIKCANILINSRGVVKLCDFGCSKQIAMSVSDSSSNEEFCSSLKGTIPWCAPEVICQKKYGKKADIWSLGCTIIEMGGCQPWGKIDNLYQVMTKIGKSNDMPIIPEYYSDSLKHFISLCLVRDSRSRAKLKQLIKQSFLF